MESDSKDPRKQNSFYRRKKKKKLLYNLVCTPEEVTLEVGKCEAQNRKTVLNSVK